MGADILLYLPNRGDSPYLASAIAGAGKTNYNPLVQCTSHMCPIRIHWHVKLNYKEYWRVKITITNFNYRMNYTQWNLVVQHPNFDNLTQIFSFNYESLSPYGALSKLMLISDEFHEAVTSCLHDCVWKWHIKSCSVYSLKWTFKLDPLMHPCTTVGLWSKNLWDKCPNSCTSCTACATLACFVLLWHVRKSRLPYGLVSYSLVVVCLFVCFFRLSFSFSSFCF